MNVPLSPIRCLYRAVDLYAHKNALVSGVERYTYEEFGDMCARAASGLIKIGIRQGDRIGFLSFNNSALLAGYFAVPMIGAVLMPLNVRLQENELLAVLKHSLPKVLFYEEEFRPLIDVLRISSLGCHYIAIAGQSFPFDQSWSELLQSEPLERVQLSSIDENSPAELFYTSGSTGQPKGVVLSHRTLYLHALSLAATLDHSDEHVMLHTIPLFHANAWGFPHFATMCGMRHVMVRRFEPESVFRLIQSERATRMILVPTMANMLINFSDRKKFDLSSMQEIIIGGAAPSAELYSCLRQLFDANIFTGYGLTESGPVVTMARQKWSHTQPDTAGRSRRAAFTGWSVQGMEARVVDEHMADVPRDGSTVGEIVVRGDNVMDSYYRDPEQTTAAFTDGWLRTGDMAIWDDDSWLKIVDRKKDIIVSGGENISSVEIEQAIAAHPAVLECAVVSAPDSHWGEVPAAIIMLREGWQITREELTEFLLKNLTKFKIPRIVQFSETPLPKTGTGKIMKRGLRQSFWQDKKMLVHDET